jgi:5,10-methylenetetrahydrofolate reductase
MSLIEDVLNPGVPVTLFETVPPAASKAGGIESLLADLGKIRHLVDAINIPEIHDENRGDARTAKFVPRVEPRVLGEHIHREHGLEVIVNRCVVYEEDQVGWMQETSRKHGIRGVVLVGGESSRVRYPGPSVVEAARQVRKAKLGLTLGGISIPSRAHEAQRVRSKAEKGLRFFTTQVLFDSNDIVWLLQRLNGVEARIFLSFAPVSDPRDLEFIRWLGADIPRDLDRFLLHGESGAAPLGAESKLNESCFERSLDLSRRILMDVFDNLPPDPPPIGLNIEHINRRNFAAAVKMVERLGELYTGLVAARARLSRA